MELHSLLGAARRLVLVACLPAALLAGCGGADEPAPVPLRVAGASPDAVAASNLMDLAEAKFPGYFPSHRANGTEAPFLYRYYPETGVYLGVPTAPGSPYQYRGVYVMGGPFGSAPLFVAPMNNFLPSGKPPITALNGAGTTATFTVLYSSTQIGIDQRAATATFALDNTMTTYVAGAQEAPTIGTMMTAEASGTALSQVGRWNDGAFGGTYYAAVNGTTTINLSTNQGFHYAIGTPTPALPCGTATYSLSTATKPTRNDGSSSPGSFDNFTLTVSFAGTGTTTWTGTGAVTIDGAQATFSGTGSGKPGAMRVFPLDLATQAAGLGSAAIRGVFAGAEAQEVAFVFTGLAPANASLRTLRGAGRLARTAFTGGSCP